MESKKKDRVLEIRDLGITNYQEALEIQNCLAQNRYSGSVCDTLLLTEHYPVVTIGRSGNDDDLRYSEGSLKLRGIDLINTDRGGKATYHGPGQMVAYPIIKLHHRDLREYLEKLISVCMETIVRFGVAARKMEDKPGLYVGGDKILSVGIALRRWVTCHGVALNVNNDLTPFNMIIPCGEPGLKMTSLKTLLARPVDMEDVKAEFVRRFLKIFGYRPKRGNPP